MSDEIEPGEVHRICSTVHKDPDLVRDKERLYAALLPVDGHLQDLLTSVDLHRTGSYGFLTGMTRRWLSINSSAATWTKFLLVLREEGFNSTADKLIRIFRIRDCAQAGSTHSNQRKRKRVKENHNKINVIDLNPEAAIIQRSFELLCDKTILNLALLFGCQKENIITDSDVEKISQIRDGKEINACFYKIIMESTKRDSKTLIKLIKVMMEVNAKQSEEVLNLLNVELIP